MQLDITSTARLNNGVEIPYLGLGVYLIPSGRPTQQAVGWALEAGYRHIDTAKLYGNEADVGLVVRQSSLPRETIFVTTKLWNNDHGTRQALEAFDRSLRWMGLDYLDLYLIHWPVPRVRDETWRALETLLDTGRVRAIGVSNYTIQHLEALLRTARVVPAVNQVEFSPYLYQKDLLGYCVARGIQLEAYSPLTQGARLGDPRLRAIAARYGKTPAQIMIRWALQHQVVVIPKSSRQDHIRQNAEVFDFSLTADDMVLLDSFDEGLHMDWDPTHAP